MCITAIVVTYNRKEKLIKNIRALLEQTYSNMKILIIDNHSTDGTYQAVGDFIDDNNVIYVDTGKNLGGAGGFSFGIEKAIELGSEYVWLMDDDCIPNCDALEKLIYHLNELDNVGFIASKVLWTDGNLCTMNIPRRTLTKSVSDFSEEIIPITISSFVSLLIPTEVIKTVGLPIKEFFIWTDDWEYTRRITREYKGYLATNSIAVHITDTNSGANISRDSEDRIERYRYAYRNEIYLYRREGFAGFFHVLMRTPLHILRVLCYSKTKKIKRIETIVKGTFEGLWFKPSIEYYEDGRVS